jgi:peptide/nickel transport system permease protein
MANVALPRALISLPRVLEFGWLGHAGLVIGALIVGLAALCAIAGPALVTHDAFATDLMARLTPPAFMEGGSSAHLLGTDQVGRDYLARLVYGARISLSIGLSTVIVSGFIGAALGIGGGFFGGRIDEVVTFIITCRLAVPLILIALAVVSVVGASLSVVMLTLGLLLWDRFAVVTRAAASQIRSLDYVAAARAAGCSTFYILTREVLPNIVNPLAVVATLEMALAILLEAALSFLGLGVPAPLPSWGLMIAEARDYMFFQPWVIVIPGIALLVLVLGINLLGDGLRDLLAPESRI